MYGKVSEGSGPVGDVEGRADSDGQVGAAEI